MITGKEKIFSGKEVSDEERISLAGQLLGKHIEQAGGNPLKGIANFVTDMVVNTPVNVVSDTVNLASYATQTLINQAIRAYSSLTKTENGWFDNINGEMINQATTMSGRMSNLGLDADKIKGGIGVKP